MLAMKGVNCGQPGGGRAGDFKRPGLARGKVGSDCERPSPRAVTRAELVTA